MYYNNYGNTSNVKYMVKAIIMKSKKMLPLLLVKIKRKTRKTVVNYN